MTFKGKMKILRFLGIQPIYVLQTFQFSILTLNDPILYKG